MTVIKHKNGRFSVWSSIVDDFIFINITRKEYFNMRLNECTKEIYKELEFLDKNVNSNIIYTLNERLNIIEEIHGKERKDKVLKLLPKE